MKLTFVLLGCLLAGVLCGKAPPPPPTPTVSNPLGTTLYYINGSNADVSASLVLQGPAVLLGGGGWDVDIAFQELINVVRGCTNCSTLVDVVILRASGVDGYSVYKGLAGVDSVESLVITNPNDANLSAIVNIISKAELVFFSGGDQCNYAKWQYSALMAAVRAVYARGGGVGGTSAGMAILGQFSYDACFSASGITSIKAISNPYDSEISFSRNIFNFNDLNLTITDPHFVTRDRMGRLGTFLPRLIADGYITTGWGVAANEETSILLNKNGIAKVIGNDGTCCVDPIPPQSTFPVAYFVLLDHPATQITVKKPLTVSNLKVWKVPAGSTFNLRTRPTTNPSYTINIANKLVTSTGNAGLNY